MTTYENNRVTVEAMLVTKDNIKEVAKWCGGVAKELAKTSDPTDVFHWIEFPTMDGLRSASIGDYVVRGAQGRFTKVEGPEFEDTHHVIGGTLDQEYIMARLREEVGDDLEVMLDAAKALLVANGWGIIDPSIAGPVPEGTFTVEVGGESFTEAQWAAVQVWHKDTGAEAVAEPYSSLPDLAVPVTTGTLPILLAAPALAGQDVLEGLEDGPEIREVIDHGTQGLDFMLGLQRNVEDVWGRLVDPDDPEAVSKYIREVVLCATDELHEVLAEVNWKPWKSARGIKDLAKYREEMADVMHFILDLYLAAGLTGRDIMVDYLSKHYENIDRSTRTEYIEG